MIKRLKHNTVIHTVTKHLREQHETYLEERNPKRDPGDDSQVGLHHVGHYCEAALQTVGQFLGYIITPLVHKNKFWFKPQEYLWRLSQWTHRHVHLWLSLVNVFQSLLWALVGFFTAADRDALLFEVSRPLPVGVVFHPTAVQLHGNNINITLLRMHKTDRYLFSRHNTMSHAKADVLDQHTEETPAVMSPEKHSCTVRCLATLLKRSCINKSSLV